jgi:hypothetical protein
MGNRVVNYPAHQDPQVLQSQNQNSLFHAQQVDSYYKFSIVMLFSNRIEIPLTRNQV